MTIRVLSIYGFSFFLITGSGSDSTSISFSEGLDFTLITDGSLTTVVLLDSDFTFSFNLAASESEEFTADFLFLDLLVDELELDLECFLFFLSFLRFFLLFFFFLREDDEDESESLSESEEELEDSNVKSCNTGRLTGGSHDVLNAAISPSILIFCTSNSDRTILDNASDFSIIYSLKFFFVFYTSV